MSESRNKRRPDTAFTLVELLVVVAIIALLLSILLPSLSSAREHAKRVKCLANLKDIASGSLGYATSDPSAQVMPFLPSLYQWTTISAARKAFGGKSGLHDLTVATGFPEETPWYGGDDYGMWSTKNGFGPTKRPLNRFIYKNVGERTFAEIENLSIEQAKRDEKRDYDMFRCPSDVGYERGKDGDGDVIFGYGWDAATRKYQSSIPCYEAFGNSYGCDSVLAGNSQRVLSFGVILRGQEAVPNPARTTIYTENKGFYAVFWNNWAMPLARDYTWGWHGNIREYTTAYADGHAEPRLVEVNTDVSGADDTGYVTHSGNFRLRGGTTEDMQWSPALNVPLADQKFSTWAHTLMSGQGWQNHCQPAPPTVTNDMVWE